MAKRGFPVYDFRKDIRNVFVSPEIRCRFMRMEPGEIQEVGHSHDLGHEVFLVLQGSAVFEVDGVPEEMGPGQMCVVKAHQLHRIYVTSDEPMIMYLSVSPHIEPTHTRWTKEGKRLPHTFFPASTYDLEEDTTISVNELIDGFLDSVEAFAGICRSTAVKEKELGAALKQVLANDDDGAASGLRNNIWDTLLPVYQKVYELASVWNELAPRIAKNRGS